MDISVQDIERNWTIFSTILNRLEDPKIDSLLETIGQRLILVPFNNNRSQNGSYAGGLVEISTKLGKSMQALNEFHGKPCDIKSVYKIGLLHAIGKLGTLSHDYFLEQDSDWHREKLGHMFKINPDIKTTHLQRTLFILSQFQIVLSEEEFNALLSLEDRKAKNQLGAILLHARNMLENEKK